MDTSQKTTPPLMKPAPPTGEAKIWFCSLGLATGIIMIFGLLGIIAYNGFTAFWPKPVYELTVQSEIKGNPDEKLIGSIVQERTRSVKSISPEGKQHVEHIEEIQIFSGNRSVTGKAFRFIDTGRILQKSEPKNVMTISSMEGGLAVGYPVSLSLSNGKTISAEAPEFSHQLTALVHHGEQLRSELLSIEKGDIGSINAHLDDARRRIRLIDQSYSFTTNDHRTISTRKPDAISEEMDDPLAEKNKCEEIIRDNTKLYEQFFTQAESIRKQLDTSHLTYRMENGQTRDIPTGQIVYFSYPNQLGFFGKIGFFFSRLWEFIVDNPREANTEGGIFPAIFGTFVMTVLMSALVTPLGVIAAIYLREYAKQGMLVQTIRICVNNLAGVPSIVFGVFGLGFFVYFVGGGIDSLFFNEKLQLDNTPTFGSPGILWASLTLALMTLPVVIVATEESLSAVPRGLREASLACGASKWQTIQRIILPGALPGVLTGLILAMARGAGEVAPLMLTGVVKLAPSLPIDGEGPFVHLERKFMHLGFHIYDVGFQSPDSDAAKPMVFATTLLLIVLVITMNLAAIIIRNRLRKKHKVSSF